VQDAKTLGDFVKSADETKRFVGDSIRVPKSYDPMKGPGEGVDLTPVFKRLGMPEKAADYVFEYGEAPEGITIIQNPAEQDVFRAVAHEIGLAQWQVDRLAKFDMQRQITAKNREAGEAATAVQQGTAKLHELHGANTPNVQAHARFVYELMGSGVFGTPELSEKIMTKMQAKGLMTDPDWVTGMAAMATQLQGGRFLGAEQPISGAEGLPEVNTKIAALTAKLYDGKASKAEEAEIDRLYELKARYLAA
jgi:hypothetical protein